MPIITALAALALTTAPVQPVAPVAVRATVESVPIPSAQDAADDPAIWVHPQDPAQSTILATDKDGGLAVYDLAGEQLHYLDIGPTNNVDLRYNVPLGGELVDLACVTATSDHTIRVFRINPETRAPEPIGEPISTDFETIYGLCMYRSPKTAELYVLANGRDGYVEQHRLFEQDGALRSERSRRFAVGGGIEGMVADDELGALYIGEEEVGLWRYDAEPDSQRQGRSPKRTLVDLCGPGGHLEEDVEGLTIYYGPGGRGYLIASSQGDDTFAVYDRAEPNPFLFRFSVVAGRETDGVTHADGIDVTAAGLGSAFPLGMFVTQDDENPDANQNFKLVPWQDIAGAVHPPLLVDPNGNARGVGELSNVPTE